MYWAGRSNSVNSVAFFFPLPVSTLKEQLEDMKKISQNSQASNDKIAQLQNQVFIGPFLIPVYLV